MEELESIGNAAGQVWTLLSSKKGQVNIADIPRLTNLKSHIAYQALGWLAREGKVQYQTKAQKTFVCLVGAECVC